MTRTAVGVALLILTSGAAFAQTRSVPVGHVTINDNFRCDVSVDGVNYFATATSQNQARAKLEQAGYGGHGIVCSDQGIESPRG